MAGAGYIRKRGKHSYEISAELPPGSRGKRRRHHKTVRGNRREAEKALARLIHEIDTGASVDPSRLTLEEFLLETWLPVHGHGLSPTTAQRYESIIRLHIIPELGRLRVQRLQPMLLQRAYEKWRAQGLAPATVLQHHRVLHRALKQAVRWGVLAINPAERVELPKLRWQPGQVLDGKQTVDLLEASRGSWLFPPLALAIYTGMRRGETCALRWEDVDLPRKVLHVCRAVRVTRQGLSYGEPKTARGRRSITLPDGLVDELHAHREAQVTRFAVLGILEKPSLICTGDDGSVVHPDRFTRAVTGLVRRLGLPRVTLHGLRRTHATLLLQQNVHPKIVQERLGHSTIQITMDTYSHVLPGLQEDAARCIDDVLRRARDVG